MQLLAFHNLLYILPMVGAVLLVLMLAMGTPGGEHGGHDASGHGAHDAPHVGLLGNVLSFMGVGQVPLAITLVTFGLLWGVAGMTMNQIYADAAVHLWPALLTAAVVATVGTGYASRLTGRLFPSYESYGAHDRELVSEHGEVLHQITESGGTVRTRDTFGNLRDINVKITPGQAPLQRGARVLLTGYDEGSGQFSAEPASSLASHDGAALSDPSASFGEAASTPVLPREGPRVL